MALLPQVNTAKFNAELPDGRKISFRMFTKGEEKQILFAQQSEQTTNIIQAIADVVENCTFGVFNPKVEEYYLTEWFYLRIRSESMNPIVETKAKIEEEEISFIVDTTRIEILEPEYEFKSKVVLGTDKQDNKITIELSKPTIFSFDYEKSDENKEEKFILNCVKRIYIGDDVIERDDISPDEFVAWINNLDSKVMDEINKSLKGIKRTQVVMFVNGEETRIGNYLNFTILH